ncbi:MAG: prepilin-type N-terminal cleavage/methylation domain-containing protein [Armatimonadetes bacterium]|nr:prepilin-type N-terminal cleavage/methylation domain-containing protein [Armatimonadota bacterium]MDW8154071.1 prepilin-type N-terminal cleavage/methylation domain-containing protein [Armatimonadota bacterium]
MTSKVLTYHRLWDSRGLSLLELLLALTLLALVTLGIYALVGAGVTAARDTGAMLRAQTQVRAALDGIVDEARWAARVLPSPTPTADSVALCVPSSPRTGTSYYVRFAYDPANRAITRAEDPDAEGSEPFGAPEVLARLPAGGAGPTFALEYYTPLGEPAVDPGSVAQIRIRIRMMVETRMGTPAVERELIGDVALRQFETSCP